MHLAWCLLGAVAIANGAAIEKPYSPDAQSSPQATPIVEVIQRFPVETVDEYEIRDGIVARAAPAIVQSIGRYSYIGCYTDGTLPSRRALRAKATQNSAMTIEFCASFCAGYYWFGTEIGNQCWCGFVVENGNKPTSSGCTITCKGNSLQYCGGPSQLQMYKYGPPSKATTPSATSKSSTSSLKATTPSATSKSLTSSLEATMSASATPSNRAVFAHYMVGSISECQAVTDVEQAQAMGIDAFALNVVTSTEAWSNNAIKALFDAAYGTGFKLFFSFDMSRFASPTDAIPLLQQWQSNSSYYKPNGIAYTSTFQGGTKTFGYTTPNAGWQAKFKDALASLAIPTFFVPAFDDSPVDPASFFKTFPVVDGLFAWENSWPLASAGKVNVSSARDQAYLTAAKAAGKKYMMGISAVQYKHMNINNNRYRRGGLNLALRIPQILSLGPDYVQIQTWNDAGESQYIGPIWPDAVGGTNINTHTDNYDHSGWQILLTPFIKAYKAGIKDVSLVVPTGSATVQGVFWHSTLLSTATCKNDTIGPPCGRENIQDTINVAVLVVKGVTGVKVLVYSGGKQVATYAAVQGLNAWEVPGLVVGQVKVVVVSAAGATLISGTGPINVLADSNICNYNPQVVPLK